MTIRKRRSAGLLLAVALLLQGCGTTPQQPAAPPELEQPPVAEEAMPTPPPEEQAVPEQPSTQPEVPEPVPLPEPPPVCEPPPAPPPPPPPARPAAPKTQLSVLGEVENVRIEPPGIVYRARLDTGRELSRLHAVEVREFERDGKTWVRFHLVDGKEGTAVEVTRPLLRTVNGPGGKHYVVSLKATIAGVSQFTDFMLTDRSGSANQALIGRNFLRDQAVVDVGRRFTKPKKP